MKARSTRGKRIYRETYRAGTWVRTDRLPSSPIPPSNASPVAIEYLASGVLQCPDGTEEEFHEIRVYVKRPPL